MTRIATLILLALVPATALAAEPGPDEILRRASAILAPPSFDAQLAFTTHKANGTTTTFSIQMWKQGTDRTRFKFLSPADDRDMEVLRIGDDMWNYLPNLKRAIRVSPKQEFHGGDFSNSDVLRVDLVQDYTPAFGKADAPDQRLLELTAKNDQVAYARVQLWVRARDSMPLAEAFYTSAGKLVRKLTFTAPKSYGGFVRPSKYEMRNMLVQSRSTEMEWTSMHVQKSIDDGIFANANLGR